MSARLSDEASLRLQISSEEETSSDLSRLIFYNNWKGIYSQVCASMSTASCFRRVLYPPFWHC